MKKEENEKITSARGNKVQLMLIVFLIVFILNLYLFGSGADG